MTAQIKHLAVGLHDGCVIAGDHGSNANNQVYCWGETEAWHTMSDPRPGVPSLIETARAANEGLIDIGVGNQHACALSDQGEVYCWGVNSSGELGQGRLSSGSETGLKVGNVYVGGHTFDRLSVGNHHTCALVNFYETNVFCWGENRDAQASGKLSQEDVLAPGLLSHLSSVEFLDKSQLVYAGDDSSCALGEDNQFYCWGSNDSGKLGTGIDANDLEPTAMLKGQLKDDEHLIQVNTGWQHACGLSNKGFVYCWGSGEYGNIGNGTFNDYVSPQRVYLPVL